VVEMEEGGWDFWSGGAKGRSRVRKRTFIQALPATTTASHNSRGAAARPPSVHTGTTNHR